MAKNSLESAKTMPINAVYSTLEQIKFPHFTEPFSFFYDLIDLIGNGKQVPLREINLAGGRYTGKTYSVILFIILLIWLFPKLKVYAYIVRKSMAKKAEVFQDICNLWPKILPVKINKTNQTFTGENFFIQTVGLTHFGTGDRMQHLGIHRPSKVDWTFTFFDECGEISNREKLDVLGAISSVGQSLILNASNPFYPSSDYFMDFNKYHPWNEQNIKSKYETSLIVQKNPTDLKMTLYHWSTPLLFKDTPNSHISDDKWIEMRENEKLNKIRSDVIMWGKPAMVESGVYVSEMVNIIFIENLPDRFKKKPSLIAGCYFGFGKFPNSFVLSLLDFKAESLLVIDEYRWNYPFENQSMTQQIHKVLEYLRKIRLSFQAYFQTEILNIYANYDYSTIKKLNELLIEENLPFYFKGIAHDLISNKGWILNNITKLKYLMGSHNLYWERDKAPQLLSELENASWKEDCEEFVREGKVELITALDLALSRLL